MLLHVGKKKLIENLAAYRRRQNFIMELRMLHICSIVRKLLLQFNAALHLRRFSSFVKMLSRPNIGLLL